VGSEEGKGLPPAIRREPPIHIRVPWAPEGPGERG